MFASISRSEHSLLEISKASGLPNVVSSVLNKTNIKKAQLLANHGNTTITEATEMWEV